MSSVVIHIHVHEEGMNPEQWSTLQEKLNNLLIQITTQGETTMAAIDDLRAIVSEINESTNNIAADIERLIAQAEGGVPADEAAAFQAELQTVADTLKATAAVVPDEPPA